MMVHKKVYRTINKLWLVYIVIVIITLHLSYVLAIETKEEETQLNVTAIENNSTSLTPVAEALIRYRRQPPRTIVKHIIRPKRYKMKRVKRPKIKYSFAEPPLTYYTRKPIIVKKPTFDSSVFEDYSHMNVESADFDLPPSSYEAQSMDLDLYKHYEPTIEAASYKEIQKPPLYAYAQPELSYKEPSQTEVSYKETYISATKPRKPHIKYGVPTEFVYSTGYEKPSVNKYSFEAPASKPVYTEVEKPFYDAKNEHSYNERPRIPATTYGVPDVHIPATGSNNYNKYSVVEQKPPYASHVPTKTDTYHFAEPPQPESEPSVEITYSPSYEINIPSSNENSYSGGKYHIESHAPAQNQPTHYDQSSYKENPKYEEPPQQYHPHVSYQPTNNYESPPQENYDVTSSSHQEVSDTNQPARYQPAPPGHQAIDNYIPALQDLPIDEKHKQPPYDYPKSSYEVPIYDSIPFDASNQEEREIYPPQTVDQSNGRQPTANTEFQAPAHNPSEHRPPISEGSTPNVMHSSSNRPQNTVNRPQSPRNHLRRTRKRKRTRGSSTTVSTTKHILDVPELEEAFEKDNHSTYSDSQEPDANESQRFENVKNHNNINDGYSKGPWNPMKIRTSPITSFLRTTPGSTSALQTLATKNKRYHYKQQRNKPTTTTTTTNMTTEAPAKFEIVSIAKSRSKSYYDGVISTPRMYNGNFFRNRFRLENASTSTTSQPHTKSIDEHNFSKRTTNVFETTIFKSPLNDRDFYQNLPKNHKLI